jgi:hypothetical protein
MRVATKAKREPAPVVSGVEQLVDRARELRREVESAQTELSIIEDQLRAEAMREMLEREQRGEVVTLLKLDGTDGVAKVGRRNVWKKIAPHAEQQMRQVLGSDLFAVLFVQTCSVKVKAPMAAQFRAAAQACGLDLAKYCSISEHIAPAKDYIQTRGSMRPTLDERTNDELDELEEQIRQSTTVSYE